MNQPTQRIDLHVHSKYAGKFHLYVLNSLDVDECYTEPEDLYQRMLQRGMSMVTITDHDAIAGCLEIAHHGPHVFISEEISARFPENGCIMHVCAYGITEAQHAEIQRLRVNIYELVPYLRAEKIVHSLAHPFSPVNQRLTPELIKKSLLLFDNIEVINGQKDPSHERLLRQMMTKVDRSVLERWANRYDIAPAAWDHGWGMTAGSDDHSGLTMARAHTEFAGPATAEGLAAAIRERRTQIFGLEKTGKSYGHTAHLGTLNYFQHANAAGQSQTFSRVLEFVRSRELPEDLETLPAFLQRLVPAALSTLAERETLPSMAHIAQNGHTPEVHDEIYELLSGTLLKAFGASFEKIKDSISAPDIEGLIEELPTLLRLGLFNVPYYFGYRFFYGERRRARAIYDWLELEQPQTGDGKVAIFCDALDNVDGLGIGLRRSVSELRARGADVYLCGAKTSAEHAEDKPWLVRFACLGTFPLPGYGEYELGWPSLLEVIRWLDENEIGLIQVSTPGPVGVVAMLASRVLGIPIVGHYHTNLADFAYNIFGDRTIGRIVKGYTSWFYNGVESVIVPSHATGEAVARLGIREDKIAVIRRGVDSSAFHPGAKNDSFWRRHGLRGKNTLLYVGRVSVEKNLRFLTAVFKRLHETGIDCELGVVGDGPWLENMKQELAGLPVAFTGYLRHPDLAEAYASSDLFVFPSTTDTFGNVVLEALASGTPAIVSDIGGPSEIVRHGETGWIVPTAEVEWWVAAVRQALDDRPRLSKLARTGRTYAEQCTYAHASGELWKFYEQRIERFRQAIRDDLR